MNCGIRCRGVGVSACGALGIGSPKGSRTEGASRPNLNPRHTAHRARQHKSSRSGSRGFDVRCYRELSQKTVRKITIPSVSRQFSGSDFSYKKFGGSDCEERRRFLVMIGHTVKPATAVTKIRGLLTCACEKAVGFRRSCSASPGPCI